jgi:hypothetical protein
MKIQSYVSEYRNDFSAVLECEHCGCTQNLTTGYHDNFYHTQVIPRILCKECGLNRLGEATSEVTL